MKYKFNLFRIVGVVAIMVLICVALSGCEFETAEERTRNNIAYEKEAQANATPIPQDTIEFYSYTTDSVKGTYHLFTAKSKEILVNFLEWLDRYKYEIDAIIPDGHYPYEFYVIYKDKAFEAK